MNFAQANLSAPYLSRWITCPTTSQRRPPLGRRRISVTRAIKGEAELDSGTLESKGSDLELWSRRQMMELGAASALLAQGVSPAVAATPSPFTDAAAGMQDRCSDFLLPNGMRFIVLPRHNAPIVSCHIFANVGAADEPDRLTGIAHLLEHMAFKGTQTIGTRDFAQEAAILDECDREFYAARAARDAGDHIAEAGHLSELKACEARAAELQIPNAYGSLMSQAGGVGLNASTSHDSTQYYVSLPANKLELWMAVESARWRAPVFRELYAEKEVIKEERRMRVDNSRLGAFTERFLSEAFPDAPYGRPVIGEPGEFARLGRAEVEAFFLANYQPPALTCAVVGDVHPQQVRELAHRYFGEWNPPSLSPSELATWRSDAAPAGDARRDGPKSFSMTLPAGPYLQEGYYRPPFTDADAVVMDVISDLLSGSRSARLYKNLVETGKALYVTCYDSFPQDKLPTLFVLAGVPGPGRSTQDLSRDFRRELQALADEPVSREELLRVRKSVRAGLLALMGSNSEMASLLSQYQALRGDYRLIFDEPARVQEVTAADVQRVAKDLFQDQNCISGSVLKA